MSVREHMILRLAATPYRYPAKREADAIELVGLTPTTFWARVHRLIERLDVVAAYPVEAGRLRRVRERRASARCA